ncbi:hypothetical protein Aph02nite_59080 [Actinoplanes philippinensis]|uniref:Uncharacterized protein n=1 Tax=Actinoplanes philippinensis TaxID=35752 RepID=A0A1I2JC20_9ACTN|nr:hypothetical protein [Actinoplanes philippinensis]GIE79958.1 hypothetical protein Aph02nite_59080 [Actinoplanes philippinensis]SFF52392.1 hypothetical protein SAMN05421541_112117 [Actinoplanes philippinensis]
MRRAILALLAGGVLVTSAACSDDAKNEDNAAPAVTTPAASVPAVPVPSPTPDYTAETIQICERLDKVFTTEFGDFGEALGKMIAHKEAKETADADKAEKQAATELKAVATQIRKETTNAEDPELKTAAATSAQRIEGSAKDLDYIEEIKSTKDLDGSLKNQISEWISPLAGYCGVTRAVESPSAAPSGPPVSAAPSASVG